MWYLKEKLSSFVHCYILDKFPKVEWTEEMKQALFYPLEGVDSIVSRDLIYIQHLQKPSSDPNHTWN